MALTDILYTLIAVIMFQAYQIWNMQRKYEEMLNLMIGLHLGEINLEEVDNDDD